MVTAALLVGRQGRGVGHGSGLKEFAHLEVVHACALVLRGQGCALEQQQYMSSRTALQRHVHTAVQPCMRRHTCSCRRTTPAHVDVQANTAHAYVHMYMYTYTYMYTYVLYMYIYVHIYMHMHVCTCNAAAHVHVHTYAHNMHMLTIVNNAVLQPVMISCSSSGTCRYVAAAACSVHCAYIHACGGAADMYKVN